MSFTLSELTSVEDTYGYKKSRLRLEYCQGITKKMGHFAWKDGKTGSSQKWPKAKSYLKSSVEAAPGHRDRAGTEAGVGSGALGTACGPLYLEYRAQGEMTRSETAWKDKFSMSTL